MQATLKFLRLACNTTTSKQIFFCFAKSLSYFVWEILILQNRGNAIVSHLIISASSFMVNPIRVIFYFRHLHRHLYYRNHTLNHGVLVYKKVVKA